VGGHRSVHRCVTAGLVVRSIGGSLASAVESLIVFER